MDEINIRWLQLTKLKTEQGRKVVLDAVNIPQDINQNTNKKIVMNCFLQTEFMITYWEPTWVGRASKKLTLLVRLVELLDIVVSLLKSFLQLK